MQSENENLSAEDAGEVPVEERFCNRQKHPVTKSLPFVGEVAEGRRGYPLVSKAATSARS